MVSFLSKKINFSSFSTVCIVIWQLHTKLFQFYIKEFEIDLKIATPSDPRDMNY